MPLLRPSDPIIDSIIGTEILPVTRHHDYDKKYQAERRFLVYGSDYEGSPLVAFEDTEFDKPLPLVTENYRGIYRRDSLMFVICNTAARYFAETDGLTDTLRCYNTNAPAPYDPLTWNFILKDGGYKQGNYNLTIAGDSLVYFWFL